MWSEFAIVAGVIFGGFSILHIMHYFSLSKFSRNGWIALFLSASSLFYPYVSEQKLPHYSDIPYAFVNVYTFLRDGGLG